MSGILSVRFDGDPPEIPEPVGSTDISFALEIPDHEEEQDLLIAWNSAYPEPIRSVRIDAKGSQPDPKLRRFVLSQSRACEEISDLAREALIEQAEDGPEYDD